VYELVRALEVLLVLWMSAGFVTMIKSKRWGDAEGFKIGQKISKLSIIFGASLHFLFHGF